MNGVELPFRASRFSLVARTVAEHYYQAGADYDRFRQNGLLRLTRLRLQPEFGAELFVDRQGWATTRTIAGLLLPCGQRLQLDAGYYYELRPARQGGHRHVIFTYFRLRKPRG
jgi:hypothetical protein